MNVKYLNGDKFMAFEQDARKDFRWALQGELGRYPSLHETS